MTQHSDQLLSGPMALAMARALDERLHATLENPLELGEARLYGCTVHDIGIDDDGRAVPESDSGLRFTFLGEAEFVYDLLEGPLGIVARAFDGAAVVTSGWGAPLGDDAMTFQPSRHPDRFRILICTVVTDDGICSVVRHGHSPQEPVEMAERGEGLLPDALDTLWFGEVRVPPGAMWSTDPAA